MENSSAVRPFCVTVNVSVPIFTVPVRAFQLGFSPIATVTVSPPCPFPPSTTEIQLFWGVTLHVVIASASTTIGIACTK